MELSQPSFILDFNFMSIISWTALKLYNAEYMSLVPYSLVHGEARERHVGTNGLVQDLSPV